MITRAECCADWPPLSRSERSSYVGRGSVEQMQTQVCTVASQHERDR